MKDIVLSMDEREKIALKASKCSGCGLCVEICGSSVIKMEDNAPHFHNVEGCCSCGHCVAICPNQALYSDNPRNYRSFKVQKFEPGINMIEKLLKNKRSVREFKDEILSRDTITDLISYAEKAPSSANNRHRRYIVIQDKATIAKAEKAVMTHFINIGRILGPWFIGITRLFNKKTSSGFASIKAEIANMKNEYEKGANPIFKGAPVIILIAAPKIDVQAKDDCIIAQQYMMLYGDSVGIGSCINGYAQHAHKSLKKLLNIPKDYNIYSVGIFGYSKYTYKNEIIYNVKPEVEWM